MPGRPPDLLSRAAALFYRAAWWPAMPLVLPWIAASSKRRGALGRVRPDTPEFADRPVWIHACSVGEVNAAAPIVASLRDAMPGMPLLLTASTPTGLALARERAGVPVAWFPLDHPLTVRGFFARVRPRTLVLTETELWPGVLGRAHALGVPVALVNGRLSDANAARYARFAALWRAGVRGIAAAGMQTEAYAARLIALGAESGRVRVTGNVKFDAAPAPLAQAARAALRGQLGIPADAPVVVFGSTRPGDEALIARSLPALFREFAELRVIVAPRHLDRVPDAERALSARPTVRRSAFASGAPRDARVIVLDTLGELSSLYAIASVAAIGGSFTGEIGGHNPIEPAAHGVPVVFGPDMRNFPDAAATLLAAQGAIQAPGEALGEALAARLRAPAESREMGRRAGAAIVGSRGALGRTIEMILPLIGRASG